MKKSYFLSSVMAVGMSLGLFAQTSTFNFTGGIQTFTVPCGVDTIFVQTWGAQGGSGAAGSSVSGPTPGGNGGLGGYAEGWLLVNPGDILNVFVGGQGATPTGGFNGGANGGSQNAGGGGGASDIRVGGTAETDRVITAGGGGGGGRGGCESQVAIAGGTGGAGGDIVAAANGQDAPTSGGAAGGGKGGNFGNVQGASGPAGVGCGGFLGSPGAATTSGTGGAGGAGQSCCCFSFGSIPAGGGGGGGQIGGGGGGGGSAGTSGCSGNDKGAGGGGGSGSSFVGGVLNGVTNNGIWLGNGMVSISWNDPIPPAHTISGTTTICEGDSTSLSIPTDIYSTFYTWTVPSGLTFNSGQNTPSINITGAVAGIYWVYVMGVNGTCNFNGPMDSIQVTINGLPNVVATSAGVVCFGDSSSLAAAGANTYDWQPGSLTGSAITVGLSSSTTYTVTGTDANGCSSTTTVTADVNQLPDVLASASATSICLGDSIVISGSGAVSYVWQPGNITSASFLDAPTGTTTYSLTGTDQNGCSDTASITITVNPLPTVTITGLGTHCLADGAFTLTQGSPVGGTYSGPGVSGSTFTPANAGNGTHTITYTFSDVNGCSASATSSIVVNGCVGMAEVLGFPTVTYMPNPATTTLQVRWDASKVAVNTIEVRDVTGRLIATQQVTGNGAADINVETLPVGNYSLILISSTGKANYQFIKQ
jgi:PKD-like domain/Secretion system C-terminal sorting domain